MSRMRMRLHPNRRESRDQTPGPIMDSAAPIVAKRILPQGSPDWVMKAHNAAAETTHPETGVHKPTAQSAPAIIAANCTSAGLSGWPLSSPRKAKLKTAPQATSRKIKRPAPGQPCANVEKRRRKKSVPWSAWQTATMRPSPDRVNPPLFWAGLRPQRRRSGLENPALNADHRSVRPVVRPEFGENTLNATFDRVFCN